MLAPNYPPPPPLGRGSSDPPPLSPFAQRYKAELSSLVSTDRATISFLKGLAADVRADLTTALDVIVAVQQRLYEVSPPFYSWFIKIICLYIPYPLAVSGLLSASSPVPHGLHNQDRRGTLLVSFLPRTALGNLMTYDVEDLDSFSGMRQTFFFF